MRGVFIAGTDTGVGKTLFAAGLAWTLRKRSFNVGIMKPFATAERVSSRKYRSSDVAILAKAANATEGDYELNPVFYEVGASPLMAAEMTGKPPPVIQTVLRSLRNLSRKHEFLIVEGIGGVMVPLTFRHYLLDFAKLTGLPVLIVTRGSIGTLNHTLLTVKACRDYRLSLAGIVVNMMPKKATAVEENTPEMLSRLAKLPVLGVIPRLVKPSYLSAGRAIEKYVDLESLLSMK